MNSWTRLHAVGALLLPFELASWVKVDTKTVGRALVALVVVAVTVALAVATRRHR